MRSIQASDVDFSNADQLIQIIKEARKICRPYKRAAWAQTFAQLRFELDESERITKVLCWYARRIGKPFIPMAFSASSFREKFTHLEIVMERELGPSITISDEAKRATEYIIHLGWSHQRDKVPLVVQSTLTEFTKFRRQLVHQAPVGVAKTLCQRFHLWLTDAVPSPNRFIEIWMRKVFEATVAYDKWNGDLLNYAFNSHHKIFTKIGEEWGSEYCNYSPIWKELMEELDAN